MKKLLSLIFAAAFTLSLCACDKADNDSKSGSDVSGSSLISGESTANISTGHTAPVGGESTDVPDIPSAGANPIMLTKDVTLQLDCGGAYETDDGVYYIKKAQKTGVGSIGYIMYIDYATGQETYLCSDSSCDHNSERCSSYLDNDEFFYGGDVRLFEYDGSLYYLNLKYTRNEDSAQVGSTLYEEWRDQSLYRMGLDGTNRELVYTFDKDLNVESFAAGDGNALWFFVKTPTVDYDEERKTYFFGVKEPRLIKLDLSSRSIVEQIPLYKYKELERVFVWGCSNGKMILCGREFPEDVTRQDVNAEANFDDPAADSMRVHELFERCKSVYFTLDLNNKEIKEIYRHGYDDEYRGFTDGKYAYLTDTIGRSSVKIDVESGEQSEFFPAEGYVAVGTVGGKYECRSVDKNDLTVYFIDKESGEITSNSLEALYTDDVWMIIHGDDYDYKNIREDAVAFGKDSVLIRTEEDYVIMSIDDYFNGRPEYRPVNIIFQKER